MRTTIRLSLLIIFAFSLFNCRNMDSKNDNSALNSNQTPVENSSKEICSLLETILDYDKVRHFIHYEKDSIFYIYNNPVLGNYQINFTDNKYILTDEIKENMNYIEFTSILFEKEDHALVSFNIPKQGVTGEITLKKNDNTWYIFKETIFEY